MSTRTRDPGELIEAASRVVALAAWVRDSPAMLAAQVREQLGVVGHDRVERELASLPIEELEELLSSDTVLKLKRSGCATVAAAAAVPVDRLASHTSGVGGVEARAVMDAIARLRAAIAREFPLALDAGRKPAAHTGLLTTLWRLQDAEEWNEELGSGIERILSVQPVIEAAAATAGGVRRLLAGREKREAARAAVDQLDRWLVHPNMSSFVSRLNDAVRDIRETPRDPADAWSAYESQPAEYTEWFHELLDAPEVHPEDQMSATEPLGDPKTTVRDAELIVALAREVMDFGPAAEADVRPQFEVVRRDLVDAEVSGIGTSRLKETTEGRVRLDTIERAGFSTVGSVLRASRSQLEAIPGVGANTAIKVLAAARQLRHAVEENLSVRLDTVRRPDPQTALLRTLWKLEYADRTKTDIRDGVTHLIDSLVPTLTSAATAASRIRLLFAGRDRRTAAFNAVRTVEEWLARSDVVELAERLREASVHLRGQGPEVAELWDDYGRRASDYYARLGELADLALDVEAARGYIPAEIVERVNHQQLDDAFLDVALRGYQAFGAKFALVQRRTLIGDEMGLGKTIEAIAAMAHLQSIGAKHFLVVCPLSVLPNWLAEIRRRSRLDPFRLHGNERESGLRRWQSRGGVAVATYDSLKSLRPPDGIEIAMLVADEAHYVKNVGTQRRAALRPWRDSSARVLLMTGTPLENRLDDFRSLVDFVQPEADVSVSAVDAIAGPAAFRRTVAPVYLRRNQPDVLTELPERLEVEDWVELSDADEREYRAAVVSGNFMAMRRAPLVSRSGSAKLERLREIVEESTENGWKVVIFSYFLDVLAAVESHLGSGVIGPLTGKVQADMRQRMVDDFTAIDGPAVLLGQITAAGTGLNIQAASVVVLTEPQVKPSIEEQAIARCHRMGQIRRVHVHRLLAKDSADARLLEILAEKARLFDEYVRESAIKDASPESVDVSQVDQARIVAMEQVRLGISPTDAPDGDD